jgi:hypothetical protein
MNFLQLAQKVALESGTVPGDGQPVTVFNQTGRLAAIVRWTADAWLAIQNHRQDWRWMRGEFTSALSTGQSLYPPAILGIADFADWTMREARPESNTLVIHDPAVGLADEGRLIQLDYETFYHTQRLGPPTLGRPRFFAVTPGNELAFSPVPDKDYLIRGMYRKAPQVLQADADVPHMPARFHDLIVYRALVSLGTHDESMGQLPIWMSEVTRRMSELERDQLPKVTLARAGSWLDN